ncbi:hypothetical protein D3C85_1112360 [compost metagenome]
MSEHLFDVAGGWLLPVLDLAGFQIDVEDQVIAVVVTRKEVRHVAFVAAHFFALRILQAGREAVIPPFLVLTKSRGQATRANFCLGFGRS